MKKNTLYVTPNVDKKLHQEWGDKDHPTDDLLNIPRPYRLLITATPNCGKTMTIKNLLIHMKPTPENIFIAHAETWGGVNSDDADKKESFINYDVESIPEYEGVKAVYLRCLPPLVFYDQFKDKHNLLIIDDVNLRAWSNKSRVRMDRLDKTWSWASTHRNLTIICALQSIYQQGVPSLYRFSNVFIVWKQKDKFVSSMIARNTGVELDDWKKMFELCKSPYDSITIDSSLNSPAPLRFNLVQKIVLRKFEVKKEEKKYVESESEDEN